jgi:adenylate cyclase class IV
MKTKLPVVTTFSKEKYETLIKLSQYLEIDYSLQGTNFINGEREIEKIAARLGLSCKQCV